MHDPSTVAFEIRYPWKAYKNPRNSFEKDYRESFITIWHEDPETDGTDDSCGWFIRARHADKTVLEKIIKRFEFDWDRTYTSDRGEDNTDNVRIYPVGLFRPNGDPYLSVHAIVLNLFRMATWEMMGERKATKYINNHLADILIFAENPFDSLHDIIIRKFEKGCNEPYTKRERDERLRRLAAIIYTYILRDIRPWYKHPRWHIHHWRFQIHPWQRIRRLLFDRCCICKKRFKGETPMSNWGGTAIWHQKCEVHPEKELTNIK